MRSLSVQLPPDYKSFLSDLKDRIRQARLTTAIKANTALTILYWEIGREILQRQNKEGWGTKVVDRLAQDLRREFVDMKGFSRSNLLNMRAFTGAYPDKRIVQQLVGQIPWGHNMLLINRFKDSRIRLWYVNETIKHGWSRAVLNLHIEVSLHTRQGKAITNFKNTLPPLQSDLAQQSMKDPYLFDFLSFSDELGERSLEKGLIEHIRSFLLELGAGFSFVGQQFHIEVDGKDYYIDLLFYHLKLRCYVVIELKSGPFKPEYAGKMNFYLSAIDDILRHPGDKPTIGLILCKERDRVTAEYAIRDMRKPIGISQWKTKLVGWLPKGLKDKLPSVKDLEDELIQQVD